MGVLCACVVFDNSDKKPLYTNRGIVRIHMVLWKVVGQLLLCTKGPANAIMVGYDYQLKELADLLTYRIKNKTLESM